MVAGVLDELVAEARDFLAAAEAEGTRRNYATDWRAFVAETGVRGRWRRFPSAVPGVAQL